MPHGLLRSVQVSKRSRETHQLMCLLDEQQGKELCKLSRANCSYGLLTTTGQHIDQPGRALVLIASKQPHTGLHPLRACWLLHALSM